MLRNHTLQGHVDGSGGDASPLHSRRVGGGYLYDADQRDDHNDHGDTRPNHRRPAEDSRPAPGPAGSPDRGRNAGEASGGPGSANASTRDGDAGAITRVAAGSETTQRAHRHHHRHSHRSHHSHPQRSQAATTARAEAVDEANRAARAAAKAAQAAAAILASFDNEGDGDESDAFLAELGLDVGVDLVGAASGDAGSAGGTGGGDGDGTPNAGLASATALSPVATPNRNRRPAHTAAASPGPGGAGSHTGDDGGGHDDSWQGGDDSFVQELLSDFPRSGDPAIDGAIQGLSSFTARLPPSNHKRGAASQGAASPAARLHAPPSPGQRLAASSPARPQLSSGATASECVAVGPRCSARSSTCGGAEVWLTVVCRAWGCCAPGSHHGRKSTPCPSPACSPWRHPQVSDTVARYARAVVGVVRVVLWCAVASTTDGCLPHPMHLRAGPRTGLRRIPCHAVTLRVHPPNPGPRTGSRKPVTAACTVGVASTTPRICVRPSVAIGGCSWGHVHASFAVIRRDGGVAGQGSPEP